MKAKHPIIIALLIVLSCNVSNVFSQATSSEITTPASSGPNTPFDPLTPGFDFLGWAPGVQQPLEIRTDDQDRPQPINWFTRTMARMQIFEDPDNPDAVNSGFVGIGDFDFVMFGSGSYQTRSPQHLLHLHLEPETELNDVYEQWTNKLTTSESDHGLLMGLEGHVAHIKQQEDAPLLISARDQSYLLERIRVTYGPDFPLGNDATRVSISRSGFGSYQPVTEPISILHLGEEPTGAGPASHLPIGGQRTWMEIGTFCGLSTDMAYFGLKFNDVDDVDAVVTWGDNVNNAGEGANNLRFIFSSIYAPGAGGDQWNEEDALEVGRFSDIGKFGIGNMAPTSQGGTGINPHRRLEIYDQNNEGWTAEPQLRLTYTPNTTVTAGIWTDFQTTSLGDLYIHANSGSAYRNVGINTDVPAKTLEIDADAGLTTHIHNYTGSGGGISGLRFNDLASSSASSGTSLSVSGGKVLSVNSTGDVVLVDDAGASSGDVVACSSGVSSNYLTKWIPGTKLICKSEGVYEETTSGNYNVGIGVGTAPNNKLHVGGNINVDASSNVYKINNVQVLRTYTTSVGTSTFVGKDAGGSGTGGGSNSTFVGYHAGTATTGGDNTFVGDRSGVTNLSGERNAFVGQGSGYTNYDGSDNSFFGAQAGYTNSSGEFNLFAGAYSGFHNSTGNRNVYLGYYAGHGSLSSDNVFIGYQSGTSHTSGDKNTFIGKSTVDYNPGTDGLGTSITLLGYGARAESQTSNVGLDNATAIGALSKVKCDDCLVLGSTLNEPSGTPQTKVGIGYTNPTTTSITTDPFLLYVNKTACAACTTGSRTGNNSAFFKGDIYTSFVYNPSDSSLKSNIQPLSSSTTRNIIDRLQPRSYTFNQVNNPQLYLPDGLQYGLIAEEVEGVLPGLVKNITAPAILDSAGSIVNPELTFKAMNYTGLIPLLLANAKDQQNSIDSLKRKLEDLAELLESCCNQNHSEFNELQGARLSVNLENTAAIILDQNTPNPFAEQTTITFTIPDEIQKAQIVFYEKSGKVMKMVEVQERGTGSLTVFAEKLSSGIYSYSLIADGKLIDTKKMVCSK